MTKIVTGTLVPGPELDALILEKVFGEKRLDEPVVVDGRRQLWWQHDDTLHDAPPCFSSSIEEAWEVVEKFRKEGRVVLIDSAGDAGWRVIISVDDPEQYEASEAETAPWAICLAALRAIEAEI